LLHHRLEAQQDRQGVVDLRGYDEVQIVNLVAVPVEVPREGGEPALADRRISQRFGQGRGRRGADKRPQFVGGANALGQTLQLGFGVHRG
jgi:hypothetical protein